MILLNEFQKTIINNKNIDILLFELKNIQKDIIDNLKINENILIENKEYKVLHYEIISFYELLRYLDPATIYMNKVSCYNYEQLTGTNIRSSHKFKQFLNLYFNKDCNFDLNDKNLLIMKIKSKTI